MAATTIRAAAHEYAGLLDDFAADIVTAALTVRSISELKFASPEVERAFATILSNAVVDTRRKWKLPELGATILEQARQFEKNVRDSARESPEKP